MKCTPPQQKKIDFLISRGCKFEKADVWLKDRQGQRILVDHMGESGETYRSPGFRERDK